MCWKEYKPPAECTEDGSTKTCSIVTNHFTAYALVIQKAVTAIMPAAVAAVVAAMLAVTWLGGTKERAAVAAVIAAMLAVAWLGGTTEMVVLSAAVGLILARKHSALWSRATTMMRKFLLGSPVSFL